MQLVIVIDFLIFIYFPSMSSFKKADLIRSLKIRIAVFMSIVLVIASTSAMQVTAADEEGIPGILDRDAIIDITAHPDVNFYAAQDITTNAENWEPQEGDFFEVNVENNMGRLYHKTGEALEFQVVTGQRRIMWYRGVKYFGGTPATKWVAKELNVKWDHVTYGKTGRFFRLYDGGTQYTAYGIHGFGREDSMFKVAGRYGSLGCIIVREQILNLIQKTFDLNNKSLSVRTFPQLPALAQDWRELTRR